MFKCQLPEEGPLPPRLAPRANLPLAETFLSCTAGQDRIAYMYVFRTCTRTTYCAAQTAATHARANANQLVIT